MSGPITGVWNYRDRFRRAKEQLEAEGYDDIINPAELCEVLPDKHTTWEGYMAICLDLLQMADVLVLLPGWEESRGAQRELGYALAKDMIVLEFESMKEKREA